MKKVLVTLFTLILISMLGIIPAFAQTSGTINLTSGSVTVNGVTFTAPPPQTIPIEGGDDIEWDTDASGEIELAGGHTIDLDNPNIPPGTTTSISLSDTDDNTIELEEGGICLGTMDEDAIDPLTIKIPGGTVTFPPDSQGCITLSPTGGALVQVVTGSATVEGNDGSTRTVLAGQESAISPTGATTPPTTTTTPPIITVSGVGGARLPLAYLQ